MASADLTDSQIRGAVKETLAHLANIAPGRAIEVRVPPYAAIQCGEGPSHSRGTPPNIIEMQASTWLALADGSKLWSEALAAGEIRASGARADLSHLLPLEIRMSP
jgi:hypothetical protein